MSTYTSSTTLFTTTVADLAHLGSGEFDAIAHGLCSARAAAIGSELTSASAVTTTDLAAAWARIDQALPGWEQHLPAASITALTSARGGVQPLASALGMVAQDLATLERAAATATAVDALGSLGYTLLRADGAHTSAIEARRGHEVLLVTIEDQGRTTTDHAGLTGDTCTDRQEEFAAAMHQRGVLFDEQVTVRHDDPRGGAPIANAARAGGASLAHGAVIDGDERQSRVSGSLLPTTARQARRIVEGGAR